MQAFTAYAAATAVTVALMIESERRGSVAVWALKPVASMGFILAAVTAGATGSAFGVAVLVGLALSWWGDVLLLSRERWPFLAGLGAFLLAHVAYAVAFLIRGVDWAYAFSALALLAPVAALIGRGLDGSVPAPMRVPVRVYTAVITVMVALAVGTAGERGGWWIVAGAVMFYLSDLSVALDRFVSPGWKNKLWGWPLYYGAQLVLAWCAGR